MNLSICIITKNEEQNIDRCLKALVPYGLETIVVDTGSTDRTKQPVPLPIKYSISRGATTSRRPRILQ